MFKLLFLTILAIGFLYNMSTDFSVDLELVKPANAKEISLKVHVKNLSNSRIRVLKNRRQDYKRKKIKSLGNYIIEVEKWETDRYNLFEPSADIGLSYEKEEYMSLQKGGSIIDTLYIPGLSFSRGNPRHGFPLGTYRVRISFNSNEWSSGQANSSNWLDFKID
jgi:hypothetical protein